MLIRMILFHSFMCTDLSSLLKYIFIFQRLVFRDMHYINFVPQSIHFGVTEVTYSNTVIIGFNFFCFIIHTIVCRDDQINLTYISG